MPKTVHKDPCGNKGALGVFNNRYTFTVDVAGTEQDEPSRFTIKNSRNKINVIPYFDGNKVRERGEFIEDLRKRSSNVIPLASAKLLADYFDETDRWAERVCEGSAVLSDAVLHIYGKAVMIVKSQVKDDERLGVKDPETFVNYIKSELERVYLKEREGKLDLSAKRVTNLAVYYVIADLAAILKKEINNK